MPNTKTKIIKKLKSLIGTTIFQEIGKNHELVFRSHFILVGKCLLTGIAFQRNCGGYKYNTDLLYKIPNQMAKYQIKVNDKTVEVEAMPDTPLLWVLRDQLSLTGTKYGCGIAMCGACTVHVNGIAMRSCSLPIEQAGCRSA